MRNISLNSLFLIVALFFSSCSDESSEGNPELVLKSYFESKDINERALYILTDENFNPKTNNQDKNFIPNQKFLLEIMKYHYDDPDFQKSGISNVEVKNIDCSKKPVEDSTCQVNATWSSNVGVGDFNYDMQFKSDEWKVDWVKTQDFSFNEYKDYLKAEKLKKDKIYMEDKVYRCKDINANIAYDFSFTDSESSLWEEHKCSSLGFIKCTPLCAIKVSCRNGCFDTYHYD